VMATRPAWPEEIRNGQHSRRTDNTWPFPLLINLGRLGGESMGRGWAWPSE
jgi:hypothetical protein